MDRSWFVHYIIAPECGRPDLRSRSGWGSPVGCIEQRDAPRSQTMHIESILGAEADG